MTRWMVPAIAAATLVVLGSAGCKPSLPKCAGEEEVAEAPPIPQPEYVLLEYRIEQESGTAPVVDKRETPKYAQVRPTLKKAAIRFPDSCLNQSAGAVTGVAANSQNIMGTFCGPWLSELERALSTAGYTVYSSDALYRLEKEKNLSPYNAGKELGADVVFILNSLEAATVTAGAGKEGKFRFFTSDAAGHKGEPKPLDEPTMNGFVGVAQSVLKGTIAPDQVVALSSILDATAVLTASGESVWFYRRVVTFPIRESLGMAFLFGRYPDACAPGSDLRQQLCTWRAVGPELPIAAPVVMQPAPMRSELTVRESVGPSSADAYQAQKLELIRAGAKEFVSAFQGAP